MSINQSKIDDIFGNKEQEEPVKVAEMFNWCDTCKHSSIRDKAHEYKCPICHKLKNVLKSKQTKGR